jgi:hypothetical protein
MTTIPAIDAATAQIVAAGKTAPVVEGLRASIAKYAGSEYLKFQYAYEDSPICVADGTPPPPMDALSYTPSARPGSRAPHAWLEGRVSTLDHFGDGFTLLRLGAAPPDGQELFAAAVQCGVLLKDVPLSDQAVVELYQAALVLVRPDGHVAWRGDACPDDPIELIDHIRGMDGQ